MVVRRFDFATGTQTGLLGPEHWQAGIRWIGFSPDGLQMVGSRDHRNILLDLLERQFPSLGPFAHRRPHVVEIHTGRAVYSMPMALGGGGGHPATSCAW